MSLVRKKVELMQLSRSLAVVAKQRVVKQWSMIRLVCLWEANLRQNNTCLVFLKVVVLSSVGLIFF